MKHIPEWPSTSNAVESKNARLRKTLRLHRGLPLLHRIKAILWWGAQTLGNWTHATKKPSEEG